MTTHSSPFPYDWVPAMKPDLKQIDSIPLTGRAPPFPWAEFSKKIGKLLEQETFVLEASDPVWLAKESLFEGFGGSPFSLSIAVHPLEGMLFWMMSESDVALFASLLLTQNPRPLSAEDHSLAENFMKFLAAEMLYQWTEMKYAPQLIPCLLPQKELPTEDALCREISIRFGQYAFSSRLVIPSLFRAAWVKHFSHQTEMTPLSQKIAKAVPVVLHIEAASTCLMLADLKKACVGDLLLLDQCSLDSSDLTGRVLLTVNGKTAFRAKLKDKTIKILERPLLQEVKKPMNKQNKNDSNPSDFDLDGDEDLFSDMDHDLFSDELLPREEPSSSAVVSEGEKTVEQTKAKGPFSPEEIPVTVVVEVGQIEMAMGQLLQLEPGNLLEVDLDPQKRVSLTVNGKEIGIGDLVRIGDALAVRILELGKKN